MGRAQGESTRSRSPAETRGVIRQGPIPASPCHMIKENEPPPKGQRVYTLSAGRQKSKTEIPDKRGLYGQDNFPKETLFRGSINACSPFVATADALKGTVRLCG